MSKKIVYFHSPQQDISKLKNLFGKTENFEVEEANFTKANIAIFMSDKKLSNGFLEFKDTVSPTFLYNSKEYYYFSNNNDKSIIEANLIYRYIKQRMNNPNCLNVFIGNTATMVFAKMFNLNIYKYLTNTGVNKTSQFIDPADQYSDEGKINRLHDTSHSVSIFDKYSNITNDLEHWVCSNHLFGVSMETDKEIYPLSYSYLSDKDGTKHPVNKGSSVLRDNAYAINYITDVKKDVGAFYLKKQKCLFILDDILQPVNVNDKVEYMTDFGIKYLEQLLLIVNHIENEQ
jgi:hypothetical protein